MISYAAYILLVQFFTAVASMTLDPDISGIAPTTECEVCSTERCNTEATFYKSNMDTTVDPCDDFHQFVCGGFLKKHANFTDTKAAVNQFSIIQRAVDAVIIEQLNEDDKPSDLAAFKKVKTHWRNCMDKSRIETDGTQPILELLQTIGGWPIVMGSDWNESEFDLTASLQGLREKNFPISFPFQPVVDITQEKTPRLGLFMKPPALTYTSSFFTNQKFPDAYRDYIKSASILLGANESSSQQEASEVGEFKEKLFTILMNVPDVIRPASVDHLSNKVPTIPWLELFKIMLKSSGIRVNDKFTVFLNLKLFSKIAKLIHKTPKRVLANYLGWSVVQFATPYLPESFNGLKNNFNEILAGMKKHANREHICLYDVMNSFEIGLSSMYVRRHFDRRIKSDVEELFSYIKHQTRRNLEQVDWMEKRTKRAAIEKLEAMRGSVAYTEELFDDQKIDDHYGELDIAPGNRLTSALNIAAFKQIAMLKDLGVEAGKDIWKRMPSSVDANAFIVHRANLVFVAAGILQGPFYEYDRPQYLNYGGIGTILGHEIAHAFDDNGRLFDRDGRMGDWWDPVTKTNFFHRMQCLIDQYENFVFENVDFTLPIVNGIRTLSENVADNLGIKTAYQAYNEWASRNRITEMCLPDLERYTARQMFWISAASVTCDAIAPEALRNRMSSGVHSPGVARSTIPFANIPEFAQDFQCAMGSRMHPVVRCSVW